MLPFAISVTLLVFWTWLGLGLLAAVRFSRHAIRNLLLAPVTGASLCLLPMFWLSRLGLPVRSFARPLAGILLLTAGLLWWRYRPRFPWRSSVPFLLLLGLSVALSARPMFRYGFNWISYANDDMANYVLASERLYLHGYLDTPTVQDFVMDRDPTQNYWFIHVYLGARTGSELMLAWVHGVFGRTALELFMPLILAFYFLLIATVGGLVYRTSGARVASVLTCLLLACSALTTLGLMYQLIAQIWGLSLVAGSAAFVIRPLDRMSVRRLIPNAILCALAVSALIISYPETLPFLLAPVALFAFVRAIARNAWRGLLRAYAVIVLFIAVLINSYAYPAAAFFLSQSMHGVEQGGAKRVFVFPYYLVPSGLSDFWGLLTINHAAREPWLSMSILLGAGLSVLAIAAVAWQARHLHPAALVSGVMMLLAVPLFVSQSDFGLFKLAMLIQPFLLATIAVAWTRIAARYAAAA